MRFWLALVICIPFWTFAQERCGADQLLPNSNRSETHEQFANWINAKIQQKKLSRSFGLQAITTSYQLPVVFHIIHNGSEIGSGQNLSDEKILEQFAILNNDFRRLNEDTTNTPTLFKSVAADTEINFVMAKQDPEGLPTTGITRTKVSESGYSDFDAKFLTSVIQWPPEDYINIYITHLTESLGFAVFPFSDLGGLRPEIENFREFDGVFVNYKYTGLNDDSSLAFDSYGRTLTHEMGHYLGLLHVFHGGCTIGDYCNDTPSQRTSSKTCNTIPNSACDEEERPMVENYLDYTRDECMNLFTLCQKDRMQTVIENSPRRKSLLTSHGLQTPIIVANDLGIREIRSPLKISCNTTFIPAVQVRNYGNNTITTFKISLKVNDVLRETASFSSELLPDSNNVVSFSSLNLSNETLSDVSFEVIEVNGSTDGKSYNNIKSVLINPSETSVAPYQLAFDNEKPLLSETEIHTESRWQISPAPDAIALNQAAGLVFYQETSNYGIKDMLFTDVIDVSSLTSAQLTFKYAYSGRNNREYLDELIVAVSTDCGTTYPNTNYIFSRNGNALVTTSKTDNEFVPVSETDWDQVDLNITPFLESDQIQIAFIGVNGGGNNLYIDDISITSANLSSLDVGIRRVTNAPLVTCRDDLFPTLNIRNYGYKSIHSMDVAVNVNDSSFVTNFTDLNIQSGESKDIKFTFRDMIVGMHEFSFNVLNINDSLDKQPDNNAFLYHLNIDTTTETVPVRQTFDVPGKTWIINEINGSPLLELEALNARNTVLKATAFDTGTVGSQSYFVSPILHTNKNTSGAIRFKVSHAERPNFTDNLKVLLSVDCGSNYEIEVYNKNSSDMASTISSEPWRPTMDSDWKTQFIDISEHMQWGTLRVAFVFTNGQGNNLYLDDIELLTSSDPNQLIPETNVAIYPNPASERFFVSFKLPVKQTVNMKLIDMTGKILINHNFENILNQKFEVESPIQKGFYFVTVKGPDVNQVKRIYIQ